MFIGKFAQKNEHVEHKNFNSNDINSWISFINTEKYIINQIVPINQDFIHVIYRLRREYIKENRNSNIAVAVKFHLSPKSLYIKYKHFL